MRWFNTNGCSLARRLLKDWFVDWLFPLLDQALLNFCSSLIPRKVTLPSTPVPSFFFSSN